MENKNYKQLYEEAIERAKMILCNLPENSKSINDLQTVFPELKQPKDYYVLNEIIDILNLVHDNGSLPNKIYQTKRCGDWIDCLENIKKILVNNSEWSEEDELGWQEAMTCVTKSEVSAKDENDLQNAVTAERWLKEIKFKYCIQPKSIFKPTEEELNAFKTLITYSLCTSETVKLVNKLYSKLEKLI